LINKTLCPILSLAYIFLEDYVLLIIKTNYLKCFVCLKRT